MRTRCNNGTATEREKKIVEEIVAIYPHAVKSYTEAEKQLREIAKQNRRAKTTRLLH